MVVRRTNQQYQNQEIRRQACCGTHQKHKTSRIHLSSMRLSAPGPVKASCKGFYRTGGPQRDPVKDPLK
jgi:hypothetical protein